MVRVGVVSGIGVWGEDLVSWLELELELERGAEASCVGVGGRSDLLARPDGVKPSAQVTDLYSPNLCVQHQTRTFVAGRLCLCCGVHRSTGHRHTYPRGEGRQPRISLFSWLTSSCRQPRPGYDKWGRRSAPNARRHQHTRDARRRMGPRDPFCAVGASAFGVLSASCGGGWGGWQYPTQL